MESGDIDNGGLIRAVIDTSSLAPRTLRERLQQAAQLELYVGGVRTNDLYRFMEHTAAWPRRVLTSSRVATASINRAQHLRRRSHASRPEWSRSREPYSYHSIRTPAALEMLPRRFCDMLPDVFQVVRMDQGIWSRTVAARFQPTGVLEYVQQPDNWMMCSSF